MRDLKIPEMDGATVLQQVRSLNPDQPVIILPEAGTPEKEYQVHVLGVSKFVAKEFSLPLLGGRTYVHTQDRQHSPSRSIVRNLPTRFSAGAVGDFLLQY